MGFDSTRSGARDLADKGLTSESISILTDKVHHFHRIVAEIREWAELHGIEDLGLAAAQAEDSVMLSVRRQIRRKRNHELDRLVRTWLREHERLGAGGERIST
jgi:hypothetical protein